MFRPVRFAHDHIRSFNDADMIQTTCEPGGLVRENIVGRAACCEDHGVIGFRQDLVPAISRDVAVSIERPPFVVIDEVGRGVEAATLD